MVQMAEDANKDVFFSLKVMINKDRNKILFALVDADFADVLLSFLTLPLGKIVKVFAKHYGEEEKAPVLGSLTSLYNGLANLDGVHFCTEGSKEMLLDPTSSFESECRKLKIDVGDNQPIRYFTCENWDCRCQRDENVGMYNDNGSCKCGKRLSREIFVEEREAAGGDDGGGGGGVFTNKTSGFLISDDLRMVPNVAGSVMRTLGNLGVSDTEGAELRIVTFGFDEIMDLLKGSLLSSTPLSDIVLGKQHMDFASAVSKPAVSTREPTEKETTSISKKAVNLKLMVQESTNKLLFAQAESDFVNFLSSLLAIPLGGAEYLLGSRDCFKSIDNLHGSIVDIIDAKYLATPYMKNRLTKPMLAYGYMSENQILPLGEQSFRRLLYYIGASPDREWLTYTTNGYGGWPIGIDTPKVHREYVKGPIMYMVTDDLTVTPLCMTSTLSILKEMRISMSDVKEIEIQIGLQEALSILKASLTSTSALTDGLMINPGLKK
ncbi:hypothetical protein ACP275_13G017600 [Erythranthe tilingii]